MTTKIKVGGKDDRRVPLFMISKLDFAGQCGSVVTCNDASETSPAAVIAGTV
jgi:hypothetical protein